MTTQHSTAAKIIKPLQETYSFISRTTGLYFEGKARKMRLAHQIESLSALDPHILKDIGMEGFDRLSPAQKMRAILRGNKRLES